MIFGENFGVLAKQNIEAAATLNKTLVTDKGIRGFWQSHPQKNWGHYSKNHHKYRLIRNSVLT